jgi:hypothetical protein
MKTQRVIFRKWKKGGDVIAYFPDIPETAPGCVLSYMHIGQHGAGYYPHGDTVPATPEEYGPLLRELEAIGYDNLRIVSRVMKR